MAATHLDVKAIDLLGSSPPIRPIKSASTPIVVKAQLDVPDDAAREEESLSSSLGASYDSPTEDGGSPNKSHKRKKKMVTFAEYANEPKGINAEDGDSDEEPSDVHAFTAMRSKRSASLPHIELNPKLNKKIRKMMEGEEEDSLNTLLEGTLTLFEEKDKSTSELRYEYEFGGGQLLQVRVGDITQEHVDALVNEANSNLQHSSGIAGAISQIGGRDIQIQSDRWIKKFGPVPPGGIAVTEAGSLSAKRVIHAVGPIWRGGNSNEDHEYWDAVWHSLEAAHKHKFKTIAIPALGVGFLGFPKERCAYLLVDCVSKFWLKYPKSKLREARLVNYDNDVAEAIVFEMVGKFTAGCETSESEGYSGSEIEESEVDDEEGMSQEETPDGASLPTPEQKNIIANNIARKTYMLMNSQARRQSIA